MWKWLESLSFYLRVRVGRLVIVVRLEPKDTAEKQ
jgi:hypothetical protein